MRYGREISAAVDPLDLGWPAVAVRAGVGLVYSALIEEVVTPRSVGGRTGARPLREWAGRVVDVQVPQATMRAIAMVAWP